MSYRIPPCLHPSHSIYSPQMGNYINFIHCINVTSLLCILFISYLLCQLECKVQKIFVLLNDISQVPRAWSRRGFQNMIHEWIPLILLQAHGSQISLANESLGHIMQFFSHPSMLRYECLFCFRPSSRDGQNNNEAQISIPYNPPFILYSTLISLIFSKYTKFLQTLNPLLLQFPLSNEYYWQLVKANMCGVCFLSVFYAFTSLVFITIQWFWYFQHPSAYSGRKLRLRFLRFRKAKINCLKTWSW